MENNMINVKNRDSGYVGYTIPDRHIQRTFAPGETKKIAFEGGTIVDEYTNYDRSKEVQIYKKVGVRAIFSNDICVYKNTSLTR